ncbi:unnamed protein product [Heterobilharzia americana]|nr:unnamed protein product [Heterobilharzia americana]
MPRNMNMIMNNRRITVQQLKNYIDSQSSYLLIDIRPKTEFDICHLKSSLHIPFNELFRESVISDIREAIDNGISNKGATLPFPDPGFDILACAACSRKDAAQTGR